jgi:nitroreductase
MKISEAISSRKSIRSYLDKPVSDGDLEKIIEAGRWAPNAGPFQISLIRNAGLRQKINDRTLEAMVKSGIPFLQQRAALPGYQPLYGAPVLALLSAPKEGPLGPLGSMNTSLAAQNMILAATGLGLGSCFLVSPAMAMNRDRELLREAGIPDDYVLQCAVILGYAAAENKFTSAERVRKGAVKFID